MKKSPQLFFILAFVFAVPFLIIGAITGIELLPGLPIAALMTVCPMLAASVLVYRENKFEGVITLLKRSFDFRRIKHKIWYVPTLLIFPLVAVMSFVLLQLTGTNLPAPQIEIFPTLALCAIFFVGALGEELGWSGYVIDPMQDRWGALRASIILGAIWAVYHYVALTQAHHSVVWIAWWSLYTVAARIMIVWLYNNSGKSVFIATLFHMTLNVVWQLFPVNGSFFDYRFTGITMAVVALIIVVIWEPRTLA